MIKNVVLKKFLINSVFTLLSVANRVIPKDEKKILLYANEGFRDNTRYLYDYMIEKEYNDSFKIVCSATDYKKFADVSQKNVKFVSIVRGIWEYFSSGTVYYSFGRIPIIPTSRQVVVQMWHGTSFKGFDQSIRKTNSEKKQFYTHVFASSEFFRPIVMKKFACKDENIFICGHPRTDVFYQNYSKYDLGDYNKVIIWLPTFRKSSQMGYVDVDTDSIVPFYKTEELCSLNDYLKEKRVKLIIKLHPLQDSEKSGKMELSNLQLLTNGDFIKNNYDLYVLLAQTDALITDYSSVFYDYLLLDRPIGFTEDDEKEYQENRGFAVENPDQFKPGMRIKNRGQLLEFIADVVSGKDEYAQKRKKIRDLSNYYQDGKNCERALSLAYRK